MKKYILSGSIIVLVLIYFYYINTEKQSSSVSGDLSDKSTIKLHENIRNKRYCEILVINGKFTNLTATVYNTLGCNDCPNYKWDKINQEKLKDSLNAKSIVMNGPRVFMMDKIGQSNKSPKKVTLGGIEMVERATVQLPFTTFMSGKSKPYKEITITRSTEYVFEKGKKVYLLISPKNTYVMQSYSMMIEKNLKESDLEILNSKLKLPNGWKYQVKILENDLVLKTFENGEAHLIQDDLQNSYQRINY